jgi:hypothetical protein
MQPGWDDSTESHTLGGAVSSYFVMLDALGSRNDCGILVRPWPFLYFNSSVPSADTLALLTRRIFTQLLENLFQSSSLFLGDFQVLFKSNLQIIGR